MNNSRITVLEQQLAVIQAEIEKLKAEEQSKEVKPWRADEDGRYYAIYAGGAILELGEDFSVDCDEIFSFGNYYRTRELAEQDAKELALRGKIRQLRDALCEGYVFTGYENYYCIEINVCEGRLYVGCGFALERSIGQIYFDTKEHAQQACDILNAEMRKESVGNG